MTFSLVARCADTGMFGIAISSSSPAVAARCAHLCADVGAVAVYVALIALALDGWQWFRGLAVPILAVAAAVVCALSWLLRRRHSILTTAVLSLVAAGVFCVGIEVYVDLYFGGLWLPRDFEYCRRYLEHRQQCCTPKEPDRQRQRYRQPG